MRVVAAFVWAVAGAAWALEEGGVGSLYDQYFPPLHPNCAQVSLQSLDELGKSWIGDHAYIWKDMCLQSNIQCFFAATESHRPLVAPRKPA